MKRKADAGEQSKSKHIAVELAMEAFPVLFPYLLALDLVLAVQVCQGWREFTLKNIANWCTNLQGHSRLLFHSYPPVMEYTPCLIELYELYKRSLIDCQQYDQIKAKLGFGNELLFKQDLDVFVPRAIYNQIFERYDWDGPAVCYPNIIGVYSAMGGHNHPKITMRWVDLYQSASREMQLCMVSTLPSRAHLDLGTFIKEQAPISILVDLHKVIAWPDQLDIPMNISSTYLTEFADFYGEDFLPSWITPICHPSYIANHFALLSRLCKSSERIMLWFLAFYDGGLTDDQLDEITSTAPDPNHGFNGTYWWDFLEQRSIQLIRSLDKRYKLPGEFWSQFFNLAINAPDGIVEEVMLHLIETRELVRYAVSHIRPAPDQLILGTLYFRNGELAIGRLKVKASSNDVYECLAALLPVEPFSKTALTVMLFYTNLGDKFPPVFEMQRGTPEERKIAQATELRKRYPK